MRFLVRGDSGKVFFYKGRIPGEISSSYFAFYSLIVVITLILVLRYSIEIRLLTVWFFLV